MAPLFVLPLAWVMLGERTTPRGWWRSASASPAC